VITRKLGKFVRGNATPLQIFLATFLASWLAFVPAFSAAPGLVVGLGLLLLLFNANLAVAGAVFLPARLAALALVEPSFAVGRFLVDGPTSELFRGLINAPVLAYCGFDNYVTVGGLVFGSVFGLATGWILARMLATVRRRLAGLEEGSERYKRIASKLWVRAFVFVFVGKKAKGGYAERLEKRFGNPIRVAGAVIVVLVLGGAYLAQDLLATPVLTRTLQAQLESANGATVDVGAVELDLGGGRLVVERLALADPDDLSRDLFRSGRLEADFDTQGLLEKRFVVDRLAISGASSGEQRETPGVRTKPAEAPETAEEPGGRSLEDYLKDADLWRERLAKAREWIDKLSRGEEPASPEGTTPREQEESLRERLERQAREVGFARVFATHLIEETPSFAITELAVDGLRQASLPGELLDVRAQNLSTHPSLVAAGPRVSVRSQSGSLNLDLGFDSASAAGGESTYAFRYAGLSADAMAARLRSDGKPIVRGGTLDLGLEGVWKDGRIGYLDGPLVITLHDSILDLPEVGEAPVARFDLPVHLQGPLEAPRVRVDKEELARALKQAGADQLARRVDEERAKLEAQALEKAGELLKDAGIETPEGTPAADVKKAVDGILGGLKRRNDG